MLSKHRSTFQAAQNIIAKPFLSIPPNVMTVIGMIFPILFFYFLINGEYAYAMLAYVGNVFDALDGTVARIRGKTTAFGGVLDSTLDRISDSLIISAFGFAGLVRWEIIVPLLLFSYLVSYIRSRAELAAEGKISLAVGMIERTERLVLIFLGFFIYTYFPCDPIYGFNLLEIFFIGLLVLSVITFIHRLAVSYKKLKK